MGNPMSQLIKIEELIPNKNAGSTSSRVFCGSVITFEAIAPADQVLAYLKDFGCHITYHDNFSCKGFLERSPKDLNFTDLSLEITINNQYQELNHYPIEPYTIKWESKDVECQYCDAICPREDYYDESYWGCLVENICPICHEDGACDLRFETVDEFKERTNYD